MNTVEISTRCGKIRGIDTGDAYQFRGIKYATAGRWEYGKEVIGWNDTYDATSFGECSYQRRGFEADENCNAFYHKEFRKGMSFEYSEDCLFLNIWAPKEAEKAPVIIYIHGGSFTGGSSNEGHISGDAYAKNGIIFVSLNYRLGPFGFCSHPDIKDENGACGNFGLDDQHLAISWIKNNIEAFGGDSERIILLGQSAGAMSVDMHISSPLCEGWFAGAIMMSGAALQRYAIKPCTPEKTEKFWNEIIANAGVKSLDELKSVDEKTLFYAWFDACKSNKLSAMYTLPVYDGRIVTKQSFNMNTIPDIPIILGVTDTDMMPIALELITKKYAKKAEKNVNGCYVYNFDRHLPGDNAGAWHSCDLLYAFDTLDKNWRPFEDIDREISKQMLAMICAFARTGNPNCEEIPKWDRGYKLPLHFSESTRVAPWNTKSLLKNTFGNKGAEF